MARLTQKDADELFMIAAKGPVSYGAIRHVVAKLSRAERAQLRTLLQKSLEKATGVIRRRQAKGGGSE